MINSVLANSFHGGFDIGRCAADLDFANDVALLGVSDSENQANLHRIESLAEAVGLMINVGKSKKSKSVEDSASKFVGLEKNLTCQKCTRKFATVKGRQIHDSRYCGREKAERSRIFSCNVHDQDGREFGNVEAFKYLGPFVSLQHGDLNEISLKLREGRQQFASFEKLSKSKQLTIHLKCKLKRALVLLVVLYSSETWTINKSTQRKFEKFHTSCF